MAETRCGFGLRQGALVLQHQSRGGRAQGVFLLLRIQRLVAQVDCCLRGGYAGAILLSPRTERCAPQCGPDFPVAAAASGTGDIPVPNGSASPGPPGCAEEWSSSRPHPYPGRWNPPTGPERCCSLPARHCGTAAPLGGIEASVESAATAGRAGGQCHVSADASILRSRRKGQDSAKASYAPPCC